jgi:hypothetical protein
MNGRKYEISDMLCNVLNRISYVFYLTHKMCRYALHLFPLQAQNQQAHQIHSYQALHFQAGAVNRTMRQVRD